MAVDFLLSNQFTVYLLIGAFSTLTFKVIYESESESDITQSCPNLCNTMDYGLSGSSICGIFQARVLEWGAIAFSDHYTSH